MGNISGYEEERCHSIHPSNPRPCRFIALKIGLGNTGENIGIGILMFDLKFRHQDPLKRRVGMENHILPTFHERVWLASLE